MPKTQTSKKTIPKKAEIKKIKESAPKDTYVALLRGINVGGNTMVKMSDLKALFEGLKFTDVKTLLNSGNVIFSVPKTKKEVTIDSLAKKIETRIKKELKKDLDVIVRSKADIEEMIQADPFKGIPVTKDTRLYVVLFAKVPRSKSGLKIPYISPKKEFQILKLESKELYSVLTLGIESGTTEAMGIVENEFGKQGTTTRNWNTIQKIANSMR